MEREKKNAYLQKQKTSIEKKKMSFLLCFEKMENKRQVLKKQVCNEKMVD